MKTTLAAAVVAMVLLGACGDGAPDRGTSDPGPPPQITAGSDVTVRGPVTDVPGRHVVTIGRAGQEPLVVIFRQPTTVAVGSVLEVTGRVRTLRVGELEAELGIDLEPAVERFEGLSSLVASSFSVPA
jgi:hypothetical protein